MAPICTPPNFESIIFAANARRSEEHTSELQSLRHLVCRLLLEKREPKKGHSRKFQDVHGDRHDRNHENPCGNPPAGHENPELSGLFLYFFFNDTAPTEISTLSLHAALPICPASSAFSTDDDSRRSPTRTS